MPSESPSAQWRGVNKKEKSVIEFPRRYIRLMDISSDLQYRSDFFNFLFILLFRKIEHSRFGLFIFVSMYLLEFFANCLWSTIQKNQNDFDDFFNINGKLQRLLTCIVQLLISHVFFTSSSNIKSLARWDFLELLYFFASA